jgi:hypothetical protein
MAELYFTRYVQLTANSRMLGRLQNLPVGFAMEGEDKISFGNLAVTSSNPALVIVSDVQLQSSAKYINNVLYAPQTWATIDLIAQAPVEENQSVDILFDYTTSYGVKQTEALKVLVTAYRTDGVVVDVTQQSPDPAPLFALGIGTVAYGQSDGVSYGDPSE